MESCKEDMGRNYFKRLGVEAREKSRTLKQKGYHTAFAFACVVAQKVIIWRPKTNQNVATLRKHDKGFRINGTNYP
jgi:hypothetical protein